MDENRTSSQTTKRVRQEMRKGGRANSDEGEKAMIDFIRKLLPKMTKRETNSRIAIADVENLLRRKARNIGMTSTSVIETVVNRLGRWSNKLEAVVLERTRRAAAEQERTRAVLHHILPPIVAAQLIKGLHVDPEAFDSITVLFSSIHAFLDITDSRSPVQVVQVLNTMYKYMDAVTSHYDVYKVETIGEVEMVASGLPVRNGMEHTRQTAVCALHLLYQLAFIKIKYLKGSYMTLRLGVHTGSCVAAVVGEARPAYCLFGDTINTASRMDSTGLPLRIQCSTQYKQALGEWNQFVLIKRGSVKVKGKGNVKTYFLEEDSDFHNQTQPKYWPVSRKTMLKQAAGGPFSDLS